MRARPRDALQPTLALAVLVAMVVAAATAPAAATAAAPPTDDLDSRIGTDGPAAVVATQSGPTREGTTLALRLQPNGNARWTVSTTFALENESDRAAFADLAERFERGDADIGFDVEAFRRANRAAGETVNRSMAIRAVERNSTVVEAADGTATGRLTLNFTWTAFGTAENGTLRVGSAFNTTGGTWLPGLAAGQTLEIRPPSGYGIDTATVPPQDGILRWTGPTDFEPGDVAAAFERNGGPTATPTPTTATTSPADPGSPFPGTLVLVGGAGGAVLLVAVFAVLARRRSDDDSPEPVGGADDGSGPGPTADADTDGGEATTSEAGTAAEEGAAAGATGGDDEPEPEPEALLSDEERVERLLEGNGGRMKQANIVTETGWSNAKVSQLLSAMDEADRIDKLRIGRENLISLPDEDVTDFEEE
jgi:uncharacterized membrane protein